MAALLTERRHRSATGRGNVLEFMARSLRATDPPPQTARELARQVLQHAFEGDPDAATRCRPLHQLLVSSGGCRETVREQVLERVNVLTGSPDPFETANGLRLAVWADDSNIMAQNHRVGLWARDLWDFWHAFAEDNVSRYKDAIIAAAAGGPAMRYTALVRGLISADDILEAEHADLSTLFVSQPTFFGIVGPPHLFRQAYDLIRGRREFRHSDPVTEFAAFGRFLAAHPDPPFVTAPTSYQSLLADLPASSPARPLPDQDSLLGASLTLLLGVEVDRDTGLGAEGHDRLGALSNLYPYLARRLGIDPRAELTKLPLPGRFPELLKSWANREVNFVTA
jgi:hypothetical protein